MIFNLPAPLVFESMSLARCIENRRSIREYTKTPISISSLSQLLWAAQGITGPDKKRATPSAGGMYPLNLHIMVRRVSELKPGIYEYQCNSHSLKLLDSGVHEAAIQDAGIGDQPWLGEAAVIIGIAARLEESVKHFELQPPQGERGPRYVYMESGALAQNVQLQGTALGLGCVLVAGFDDEKAKGALRLPPDLEPTALLCIGQQRNNNA